MPFEFDAKKSVANKGKHGVDFEEIQGLWDDPQQLEIPARTTDGPRTMVIGNYAGKTWSCVTTQRGENTWIISARRAREEEVALYESEGS